MKGVGKFRLNEVASIFDVLVVGSYPLYNQSLLESRAKGNNGPATALPG
jgi:hypothetical protein